MRVSGADLGDCDGEWRSIFMRFEQRTDFGTQGSDSDACEAVGSQFEPPHSSSQQGQTAAGVSGMEVVKCGCDLD